MILFYTLFCEAGLINDGFILTGLFFRTIPPIYGSVWRLNVFLCNGIYSGIYQITETAAYLTPHCFNVIYFRDFSQ
jgi:hypothetical protein